MFGSVAMASSPSGPTLLPSSGRSPSDAPGLAALYDVFSRAALEDGVFVGGELDLRRAREARVDVAGEDASADLVEAIAQWNASVSCGRMVLEPRPYGFDTRVLDVTVGEACVEVGAEGFVHPLDRPVRIPEMTFGGRVLELPRAMWSLQTWLEASDVPVGVAFLLGTTIAVDSGESTTVRELMARAEPPVGFTPVWRMRWTDGPAVQVEYRALERIHPERWPPPPRPTLRFGGEEPSEVQKVSQEEGRRAFERLANGEPLAPSERWIVDGTPVEMGD
ncbi:MAG: hypothetical protein R3F61_15630 [Myxococcota bacterium]